MSPAIHIKRVRRLAIDIKLAAEKTCRTQADYNLTTAMLATIEHLTDVCEDLAAKVGDRP